MATAAIKATKQKNRSNLKTMVMAFSVSDDQIMPAFFSFNEFVSLPFPFRFVQINTT